MKSTLFQLIRVNVMWNKIILDITALTRILKHFSHMLIYLLQIIHCPNGCDLYISSSNRDFIHFDAEDPYYTLE